MRAFVIESHGGPEALQLRDRPLPEPGPGEARIRVLAVSLNHLDLWLEEAGLPVTVPLPPEVAGPVGAGAGGVSCRPRFWFDRGASPYPMAWAS